ncbi:MAG: CbiX/SirB N-terminal domain-containing protein [Nitrospira sp.]|nr:CbiX/SirB N-terminal domain-containing protein [Nitrospira sp.]
MKEDTLGVILVGHGGIPKDCPPDLVARLKRLEAQRRTTHHPPSQEERDLDAKVRRWPRTADSDPYQSGFLALAELLRSSLRDTLFAVAYNEFCAPTLEESVHSLINTGATTIIVTTTMFTPGGAHSEVEIPEILDRLRPLNPGVTIRYAWPFDLRLVADILAEQIRRFSPDTGHATP